MLARYVKRALAFGVYETVEKGLACHGEGPAIGQQPYQNMGYCNRFRFLSRARRWPFRYTPMTESRSAMDEKWLRSKINGLDRIIMVGEF
jgi:hypothetical protein